MRSAIILMVVSVLCSATVFGQNFKGRQKDQEQSIEKAYKRRKVSELEYRKLIHEQELIKHAIKKYEADGYWDPHEKNVVNGKLERAEHRLRRYKTNWEK